MAEPTAPFSITPLGTVSTTVSAAKRTVPIANNTELGQYFAGTLATYGGLTWGDDVSLAVTTYSPASAYTLPAAASVSGTQTGNDYITFRSASLASLPASGTRVATSDSTNMPRLNTPNSENGFFLVADTADHFRFQGLHITTAAGGTPNGLFFMQSPSSSSDTATHPHHIIVDRCLIHGDTDQGIFNAVQLCGSNIAVMNSRIYDHWHPSYAEPHAISIPGGTGPYLIQNNEIACCGCGIFVGDSVLHNAGTVPADVTVTKNKIYVPPSLNMMGYLYRTGTAALNAGGTVATITTGVVDAAWADGSTYFLVTEPRDGNGYYKASKLISSVDTGANTVTFAAWPNDGSRGASGLLYHVTKWKGVATGKHKNLWEAKHGNRVSITSNVWGPSYFGQQNMPVNLISLRGDGASATDYLFENNYIKDFASGINVTYRPTDGTGQGFSLSSIDGSQGGLVTVTVSGSLDIAGGANCEIRNVTDTTLGAVANGIWPMTRISGTVFTIPSTFAGTWTGSSGSINVYKQGTPASRIAIKNNVWENPGSPRAMLTTGGVTQTGGTFAGINSYPVLVATGGTLKPSGTDTGLSTTNTWGLDNFLMEHNTVVGPITGGTQANFFLAIEQNSNASAADYQGVNFTIRNNVARANNAPTAPTIRYDQCAQGCGSSSYGTAAFDKFSDSSRSFQHNAFFQAYDVAADLALFTGTDDDKLAILTDNTNVGFTSYVESSSPSDISNFALTNLYTTGTCTVTNGSNSVTGFTALPTTIMKGTPFKNNADGTFYLVLARVDANSLTLQSNYTGSTNTGAFTLGFKGWSSELNGADPGANIPVLAAAIAGVEDGTPAAAGFRYLPIRWP